MMDGESRRHNMLEGIVQDRSFGPQSLPLEYLRKITNNFSDERLLGEGGFGKVYKGEFKQGVLRNEDMIAVKKLTSTSPGINDRQFENEVRLLMRLKHPNIVQLVGYCFETDNIPVLYNGKYVYAEKSERLLCLEYLPKGNLREHLSDESSGLDWDTRYKIIEGICYGLHHLHEKWKVNTPIIHMDLKPSNILLDDNMVPKITDFGLSRLFGVEQTRTITESRNGTLGYMAPEYLNGGVITKKLDIFSLGVIIIEIMTGHKDYPYEAETSSHKFIELVLKNWRDRLVKAQGYPSQKIDHYQQIRRCIQIGLVCVKLDWKERPTTLQIIEMLHGSEGAECSNKRATAELACTVRQLASSSEHANVDALVSKLHSPDREEQRSAVTELQLLTKQSTNIQNCIAEAGAISSLSLQSSSSFDLWTREDVVPDEFRCPISLKLMKDPVIVATGQTYDRACIEKWLACGHRTCPTTQQRLANVTLTPNYILRNLITQWCEANGIEPPKCSSASSSHTLAYMDTLLYKLCSPDRREKKSAAAELRILTKQSAHNRICIAEAGAIPLLLGLLSSSDLQTQEQAVTALHNLSIHEDNKARIISSGAVPSIVHVLKNGSMEARENAAVTLFSLSVIDEYKVTIGGTEAIPALVVLLSEGSQQGKKGAAVALLNLCMYQGNKGRAIRAGLVPFIMGLVTKPTEDLMDEAMAMLALLSSHREGRAAIGASEPVPVLVEMIGSGTPRNRANAADVMLQLCSGEHQLVHLARAQECGIIVPLQELALNGTERGKRKAVQLLERMSRFLVQQEEQEALLQASAQALPLAPNRSKRVISLKIWTALRLKFLRWHKHDKSAERYRTN